MKASDLIEDLKVLEGKRILFGCTHTCVSTVREMPVSERDFRDCDVMLDSGQVITGRAVGVVIPSAFVERVETFQDYLLVVTDGRGTIHIRFWEAK